MDPDEKIGFSMFLLIVVGYPISLLAPVFGGAFDIPTFNGCASGCSLSTINFLPDGNPFSRLLKYGDFFGFVTGWFSSPQTGLSILSIAIGVILIVMGLQLNIDMTILGSGIKIGTGTQGARLAQSFGIGLLMWGLVTSIFTGWFDNLGFGLGAALYGLIAFWYFWGVWGWARSLR
jgi:hypothetical protein